MLLGTSKVGSMDPLSTNAFIVGNDLLSQQISPNIAEKSINNNFDIVPIGDSKVSSIWEKAAGIDVSSFGENGKVYSIFDNNFVYFLIIHDITLEWVALQWDSDNSSDPENFNPDDMEPMASGDDFWIFGTTTTVPVYGDALALGSNPPYISPDLQNDLIWEKIIMNDTEGNPVSYAWEIKRPLLTSDNTDVQFTRNYNSSLLLASNLNHKTPASLVRVKFSLSDLEIGSDQKPEEVGNEEMVVLNDVPYFLFVHTAIGIIIGSITFSITTILTVYILKKEMKNSD